MTHDLRPRINALALAYGILHRVNQSDDIVHIAASSADQVERLNAQIDQQGRDAKVQRALLERQNRALKKQLASQSWRQYKQTRLLVRILRQNGITVPAEAFAPSPGSSTTRPKAPRPTNRATPTPTGPTPSPRPLYCQLVPALCDGLPLGLPTLLP